MKRSRTKKPSGPMKTGKNLNLTMDGLPVFDAKEQLILDVTTDDITHSDRMDPGNCAAAVAAMRQERCHRAYFYRSKAYIKRKGKVGNYTGEYYERYEVPRSLRIELGAFDKGGEFEEHEFKLGAVPPSHKVAAKRAYNRTVRLLTPSKDIALPQKSHYKTYGNKKTGAKPRRYNPTKVRPRPSGFRYS